jgi:regulator of protease activity HflC (stomatin/prohibitin superfamily)
MSTFIKRLITSAVNQSVDEYAALDVNSSLDKIQDTIKQNLNLALEKNNLAGKIDIESVVVVKADLPEDLVAAVNRVVTAQSAEKEQIVKNRTAELKANENKSLASTITPQYLEYQRNEIMKEAFKNGGIEKMIIVNGSSMNFLPGGLTGK